MPSYEASDSYARRRSSHRRSSDAAAAAPRIRSSANVQHDEARAASGRIVRKAVRDALRSNNGAEGGYYQIIRTETPVIPPYSSFLAQARARGASNSEHYRHHAPVTSRFQASEDYYRYQQQYYPSPYLYGYPSGYYQEIRAPLHHMDSTRTEKSSTLVGSGSDTTTYSPTLIGSGRPSMDDRSPRSARTVEPHRTPHQSKRSSRQPRQTRVTWAPTQTIEAKSNYHHVSADNFSKTDNFLARAPAPFSTYSTDDEEEDDGLLPEPSIRPVNLSPSLFVEHETYLVSDSVIRQRNDEHERHNRAQFAALVRNELVGSAGVGDSHFSSIRQHNLQGNDHDGYYEADNAGPGFRLGIYVPFDVDDLPSKSRFSPCSSPELAPVRRFVRSLSLSRKGGRKRASAPHGV